MENLTFVSGIYSQKYPDIGVSVPVAYNVSGVEWREQSGVLATYSALLCVGALGNVAVLATLLTSRRNSRVDLLMTHLALADILVTCAVIPLEIGWKYTNAWVAGNLCCKLLQVLRAFGLYLSSNVLVCISLDRFFAVLYPLRLAVARRRSKQMLLVAWLLALACSLPQSAVFSVQLHPHVVDFEQCVSFGAFSTAHREVAYSVFCLCAMYFLPLLLISVCYVAIFYEIHRNSRDLSERCCHSIGPGPVRLRRSDHRLLARARRRTLRMTVTIVTVFALCWLPYATMTMWYMVDRDSASEVSPQLQDLLFAMAVSNSCMNPLVYGSYTLDLCGIARRLCHKFCASSAASDTIGNSGSSTTKNKNNLEAPIVMKVIDPSPSPVCRDSPAALPTAHRPLFARACLTSPTSAALRAERETSCALAQLQRKEWF